jgi:tRNA 5-methylaminomethyl-2-thiouridine biosynthesis bifunctional protein
VSAFAWSSGPCWRILDTGFEPARFLRCWQAWRNDPQRPRVLHYVALTRQIPELNELRTDGSLLAVELLDQCRDLEPGFQRLSFDQGQVLLTLCVGSTRELLREQQFSADSVYLDNSQTSASWDRWDFKALARCCRRGTTLICSDPAPALLQGLTEIGFELTGTSGHYNPRWTIKTSREPLRLSAASPGSCAVIGAGLAGASVAAALARRGWQVQLLDTAAYPAAGASALPAGLIVAHVSADDSPRSRLSRCGVRHTLHEARTRLQQGQDWDLTGVLEKSLDGEADLWHAQAGWVKPAQLVRAWLGQPGVSFCGNCAVASLRKTGSSWELLDDSGKTLASATHVVLANALSVVPLLNQLHSDYAQLRPNLARLPEQHGVRGALSWGLPPADQHQAFPPHPVNGLGSLIPAVPTQEGHACYFGATYEPEDQPEQAEQLQHLSNLEKLQSLLPMAAQVLRPMLDANQLHLWSGTRCVSADRMPMAGPLEKGQTPSLWISTAMGSRGLSFAVLCAELLASQIGAEPWPLSASLARFVQAARKPAKDAI